MREIKFRAWDMGYKKFFFSSDSNLGDFWTKVIALKAAGKKVPVMEYTSLTDESGKEIYEGDITLSSFGSKTLKGVMIFNLSKAQFGMESVMETEIDLPEHIELHDKPRVIGNVWENPELLKLS